MDTRACSRGLKPIPRTPYRLLRLWLILLRVPYRGEILWDLRWGYRREFLRRRNFDSLSHKHRSVDYWFSWEVTSAFANGFRIQARNLLSIAMVMIRLKLGLG